MLNTALKIEDLLSDSLTSPPTLYMKLKDAIKNPETTFMEFADIISRDPAFAARLLKMANSPYYGLSQNIDSIAHAIDVLGVEKLSDLTIATLVIDKFRGIPKDLVVLDEFWKHSIGCGLIAKELAELAKETRTDKYYIAGLLHDIGSLLLYSKIPVQSRLLLSEARLNEKNLNVVEKEHLGFDHAKVGAKLLTEWLLSDFYINTTLYHNDPLKAGHYFKAASIVHLADTIAYELKLGDNGETHTIPATEEIAKLLEISEDDISAVKKKVEQLFDTTVDSFLN